MLTDLLRSVEKLVTSGLFRRSLYVAIIHKRPQPSLAFYYYFTIPQEQKVE